MKEITLLSHLFIESTNSTPVDGAAAAELTKAAHRNRSKVIVGSLFIEREIEAILGFYLYPGPDVTEQQHFVAGEILGSDALTFSHKKRLILSLVNRKGWLKGQAKSDFDTELRQVISLRNAFTHGNIVIRNSGAFLEYFQGAKRNSELTDAFLTDVESSFAAVVARLETIKEAAGIPRPNAAASPGRTPEPAKLDLTSHDNVEITRARLAWLNAEIGRYFDYEWKLATLHTGFYVAIVYLFLDDEKRALIQPSWPPWIIVGIIAYWLIAATQIVYMHLKLNERRSDRARMLEQLRVTDVQIRPARFFDGWGSFFPLAFVVFLGAMAAFVIALV